MDNIDIEYFRTQLKKRLKDCHTNQTKLAAQIGVSVYTVNSWFRKNRVNDYGKDKQNPPSLENIYKVAQALDCSIDYLINPKMDCLTVTNQMIKNDLGLDNGSIETLKAFKRGNISDTPHTPKEIVDYYSNMDTDNEYQNKLTAVNMLLSNINNTDILNYIYLYITQTDTQNNMVSDNHTNMVYDSNMLYRTALKDNMFIELQKLKDNIQ